MTNDQLREQIAEALKEDKTWKEVCNVMDSGWATFTPRPDRPELFDQQHSFVYNQDPVSFCVGGNASGTTTCAAFKAANFLLNVQPPPRKNTPFWVIAENYDMVCGVCWEEKLHGMQLIPDCEVQKDKISWIHATRGWPKSVPLKPWPKEKGGDPGKNWTLEFKSYEQGRAAMQGRSIGGFWFCEQFPSDIFIEVYRGSREYNFNGSQFAEFTPIEPELSLWLEKMMDAEPPGWAFYRCNTAENKANLADGWFDTFFATVSEEMRETRMTGALATFQGVIYPTFNPAIHVFDDDSAAPTGAIHYRSIDWGTNEEHPFGCLFGYRTPDGWTITDEYWNPATGVRIDEHAMAITEKSVLNGWPVKWNAKKEMEEFKGHTTFFRDTFGDPAAPVWHNEFAKYGIYTTFSSNAVEKGIEEVRRRLKINPTTKKPGLCIHKRCRRLVEELRKYRWLRSRSPAETRNILNPNVAKAAPLKRDDDLADCLRYLLFSVANREGQAVDSLSHRSYQERNPSVGVDHVRKSWRDEAQKGQFTR
jgi:phage terminase large subunit-like protein